MIETDDYFILIINALYYYVDDFIFLEYFVAQTQYLYNGYNKYKDYANEDCKKKVTRCNPINNTFKVKSLSFF